MYTVDVGLGISAVNEVLESLEMGIIKDVIGQHRIILSKNIMNYYQSQIDSTSKAGIVFSNYIASIAGTNTKACLCSPNENYSDVKEEIVALVMQTPLKVLISDETEFANYKIRKIDLTTIDDIKSKNLEHQFNWYVFPVTKDAEEKEACNDYIKWLRRLFMNEPIITIVDPYLLGQFNLRCFIDSLLPVIPIETEIIIYSDIENSLQTVLDRETGKKSRVDYHVEAEKIINELNESNRKISINWCSGNMHDRYIVLSNCEIDLSNSLNVLQKDGSFSKSCRFYVTKEKRTLPKTIDQVLIDKKY